MLATNLTLAGDTRVRLRLPHTTDHPGAAALHARLGPDAPEEMQAARALRFDPRGATTLCATAWIGATEMFVGYGTIEHGAPAPYLLVCDDALVPGLRQALHDALVRATASRRAA